MVSLRLLARASNDADDTAAYLADFINSEYLAVSAAESWHEQR